MNLMIMKKTISLIITLLIVCGCNLSPGMHLDTSSPLLDDTKYVYIESLEKNVKLIKISETSDAAYKKNYVYKIECPVFEGLLRKFLGLSTQ